MSEPAHDIARLQAELLQGAEAAVLEPLLQRGWDEPAAFDRALMGVLAGASGVLPKSVPGGGSDPYHDVVVRHLGRGRDALVYADAQGGWRRLTFDELHAHATALAAEWTALGLEAGMTVCLVLPTGPEYLLALVTALRLGLCVAPIPPRGRAFLAPRLAALEPAAVVAHDRYAPLLGEWFDRRVPHTPRGGAADGPTLRSHTYLPEDVVLRLLSPLSEPGYALHDVPAGGFFRGLMRDALIVLGVRAGERVAFPGGDAVELQPHLLLATLLAGGCWVEADEAALLDPAVARLLDVRIAFVGPALRDAALRAGAVPQTWRLWVRPLSGAYDVDAWERFGAQAAREPRCRGMNLVFCAAAGGALLFSSQKARPPHLTVLPVPGRPWQLAELNGSGEPAAGGTGLYQPLDGTPPEVAGQLLLSRAPQGFAFAGPLLPTVRGHVYPRAEVVGIAERHPQVEGASVVVEGGSSQLVLFVDGAAVPPDARAGLGREVGARVALELDERLRPHRVRVFPLVPRREGDAVDESWVRWQLSGGLLQRKARDPAFPLLADVRRQVRSAMRRATSDADLREAAECRA